MKKFWNFTAASETEAELMLYGVLAEETWWGDEVTPQMFADELKAVGPVSSIKVRINSPGGDVFAGTTIHNLLRDHAANVTVYVDGLAASAASIIAMAGNTVVMPPSAMMMVHNPATIAWGDAREMRATADVLDKVRESMLAAYQEKTGMDRTKLIGLLNSETWMTAAEAVEQGFADEIDEKAAVTASVKGRLMIVNGLGFELDRFKTIPAAFAACAEEPAPTVDEPTAEPQDEPEPIAGPADETPVETVAETVAEPAPESEPAEEAPDPVAIERQRVTDILELATPGAEALIREAITSGASPGDVAQAIVKSDAVRNAARLAARRADAPRSVGADAEPPDAKAVVATGIAAAIKKLRGG